MLQPRSGRRDRVECVCEVLETMAKDDVTMEQSKSGKTEGASADTTKPAQTTEGSAPTAATGTPPRAGAVAVAPTGRRPPGQKEVIPLEWKLVGTSAGMPVTLLKCVDRADAEAQMARLQSERYYQDLAIHSIDAAVPVTAKMAKVRRDAIASALREASERAKAKSDRKSAAADKARSAGQAAQSKSAKAKTVKPTPTAKAKVKTTVKAKPAKKTKAASKTKRAAKTKASAVTPAKAKSRSAGKTAETKPRSASKTAKKRPTPKATKTTRKVVKKAKPRSSKRATR